MDEKIMATILGDDSPEAYLVAADFLEDHGRAARAEYMRHNYDRVKELSRVLRLVSLAQQDPINRTPKLLTFDCFCRVTSIKDVVTVRFFKKARMRHSDIRKYRTGAATGQVSVPCEFKLSRLGLQHEEYAEGMAKWIVGRMYQS